MTKNEEKSVNGNIKFKLKLIKIKNPSESLVDIMKPLQAQYNLQAQGVYQQMSNKNTATYTRGNFNLKTLEDALADLYKNKK